MKIGFLKEAGLSAAKGVGKKVVEAVKDTGSKAVRKVKERYGIGGQEPSRKQLERAADRIRKPGKAQPSINKKKVRLEAKDQQIWNRGDDLTRAGGALGVAGVAGGAYAAGKASGRKSEREKEAYDYGVECFMKEAGAGKKVMEKVKDAVKAHYNKTPDKAAKKIWDKTMGKNQPITSERVEAYRKAHKAVKNRRIGRDALLGAGALGAGVGAGATALARKRKKEACLL